jgi:hypothetical protein
LEQPNPTIKPQANFAEGDERDQHADDAKTMTRVGLLKSY